MKATLLLLSSSTVLPTLVSAGLSPKAADQPSTSLPYSSIPDPVSKPYQSLTSGLGPTMYADGGGPDDYKMDDEEVEEVDNKRYYGVDYETLSIVSSSAIHGGDEDDIAMVQSKSFVSTQGWE